MSISSESTPASDVDASLHAEQAELLEVVKLSEDPLRDYIRSFRRYSLLTAEEEVSLAKSIEVGLFAGERINENIDLSEIEKAELGELSKIGVESKDIMINSNLRLVISIARLYQGKGLDMMDLIQEGNVGLIRAVEKFDYQMGNKFSTYAKWWIRASVEQAINKKARNIGVPKDNPLDMSSYHKEETKQMAELGRVPSVAEISVALGRTVSQINKMLAFDRQSQTVSLEKPIGSDGNSTLADVVAVDRDTDLSIDHRAEQMVSRDNINKLFAVASLTEEEIRIISLNYGLEDGTYYNIVQISDKTGISESRVRTMISRSIDRLRGAADILGLEADFS